MASTAAANVAKMQSGVPLTDEDREPWLRSIRAAIESWERDEPGHVLACSALKGCYRDALAPNDSDVKFVYLRGEFEHIVGAAPVQEGPFLQSSIVAKPV